VSLFRKVEEPQHGTVVRSPQNGFRCTQNRNSFFYQRVPSTQRHPAAARRPYFITPKNTRPLKLPYNRSNSIIFPGITKNVLKTLRNNILLKSMLSCYQQIINTVSENFDMKQLMYRSTPTLGIPNRWASTRDIVNLIAILEITDTRGDSNFKTKMKREKKS